MAPKRMVRLTLLRETPGADRTMGVLLYGQLVLCQTMEPGDADLEAPRVAPGWYRCEPHGWGPEDVKFRQTWALVGRDVAHFPEPGVARSAVLLHAGNTDDQTRGCIVVGKRRGEINCEPAVLDSRVAMDALRDLIGSNPFGLTIIGGD